MAETAKLTRRSSPAGVPAQGPSGILVPNRVFIGGLPAIPSQAEIAELFAKYGVVTDVKIVPTENSRTKPYGFVTFQTVEEANKALQDTNIILRDRRLNVAAAYRKQTTPGRSSGPPTPSTPGYPASVFSTPSMERLSVPLQSVPVAQQPEVWYATQAPGQGGSVQNFVYYRNACGQYQYATLPVSPIQQPMAHYGGSHGSPYLIQNSPMQPCYMLYDQSLPAGLNDSTNSLVTLTPPLEETAVMDEAEASSASASHAAAQPKQEGSVDSGPGGMAQQHQQQQQSRVPVHHHQQSPMTWSSQPLAYCPHHSCMVSNQFARSCQYLAPSCYTSTPVQSSPSAFNVTYPHAPRRTNRLQRWNSLDANLGQAWNTEPWSRPSLDNSYSSETDLFPGARRRAHQQVPCQLHGMYSPMCVSQEFNIWGQNGNQNHDHGDSGAAGTATPVTTAQPNVSPASSASSLAVNQSDLQEETAAAARVKSAKP